jgi:hypothetical protein
MSKQKYCEDCGSKVFSLGCVNCDEDNYIKENAIDNDEDYYMQDDDRGGTGHGDISYSDADPGL